VKLLKSVVCALLSLVLVLALGISAGAAQQPASKSKTYAGYEVSVIMMTRMKAWSAGGTRFTPKDNKQEFVVIRLHVRPLEKQGTFALTRELAGVHAADGKDYEIALNKYGAALAADGSLIELPFAVPVGTQLESMHLGSVTFDLTKTPEMKPKAGS